MSPAAKRNTAADKAKQNRLGLCLSSMPYSAHSVRPPAAGTLGTLYESHNLGLLKSLERTPSIVAT